MIALVDCNNFYASCERLFQPPNPDLTDQGIQQILDYAIPSDQLEYRTVNSVRKAKPDDESVIEVVDYSNLPGWVSL